MSYQTSLIGWILILEVIEAAATNGILRFEPGLVGGHCLSVDPYYLIDKSILLDIILN